MVQSLGYEPYDARLRCPGRARAWLSISANAGHRSPAILIVSPDSAGSAASRLQIRLQNRCWPAGSCTHLDGALEKSEQHRRVGVLQCGRPRGAGGYWEHAGAFKIGDGDQLSAANAVQEVGLPRFQAGTQGEHV